MKEKIAMNTDWRKKIMRTIKLKRKLTLLYLKYWEIYNKSLQILEETKYKFQIPTFCCYFLYKKIRWNILYNYNIHEFTENVAKFK